MLRYGCSVDSALQDELGIRGDVKYSQPSGFVTDEDGRVRLVVSDVLESHWPGCGVTVPWLKGYFKLYKRACGLRAPPGRSKFKSTTMNSF